MNLFFIQKIKKRSTFFPFVLLILFMITILTAYSQVQDSRFDTHPMHWARFYARGIFDRNLIYTPLWNIGNITDSNLSPSEGMHWPGSEGLTYGSYFCFYIGAYVTDMSAYEGLPVPDQRDGAQFPIVSDAYVPHISNFTVAQLSSDRDHQAIWAPIPGFYNDGLYGWVPGINEDVNGDGELSPDEDINFNDELDLNLDPPESLIKSLAISTDKRTWPQYWPGGSYIGDTRPPAGRPPRTTVPGSRAGKWNGEYGIKTIADQESYYMMDDHENDFWNDYRVEKYWPMKKPDGTPDTTPWKDGGIAGAGIEVDARGYAWFHPLAEDILVSVYRVRNYSDYTLNRVVTGTFADPNIAGQGNYNVADYIIATYDYEGQGGRLDFDILYQWYKYPETLSTYKKIGVFGFAFLESPGIAYNGIDDDADGLIDEDMGDGIDNDGDWLPFADIGLDRKGPGDKGYVRPDEDGTEGNGIWDTEDSNLNGALDTGEDANKNDKLDMEPIRDDVGTDGVGPDENGWPGPDEDGTEANGVMNLGEPNYDVTDIDEADQAGLKHVYVYESNKDLTNDKKFWEQYLDSDAQEVDESDDNIVFTFGARNVRLEKMDLFDNPEDAWKRFTIALLMGEDNDDIVRNKSTMQQIYDNNYRFLTPPLQPTLIGKPFNHRVQLYWDSDAELSKDPFFGEDFNGYRVYKSTDPKFLDIKTISDAFGNVLLFKPLAIYDKKDGLKGAHPIPFPNLGVHYDMGKDVGLKHTYNDTLVDNGRLYYYAVTAIDAGNDDDFFERGLVTLEYPLKAMPSESPFNITVNRLGEVVYRDRNTAVVTPTEPAAGYTDPHVDSLKIQHLSGTSFGGTMNIDVFNREHVNLENEYEIIFRDDGWLNELAPQYLHGNITGIRCMNLTTGDTLFDFLETSHESFMNKVLPQIERVVYEGIHFDMTWPVPRDQNDKGKGIEIIKKNERGRETKEWQHWANNSKSNLRVEEIEVQTGGYPLPYDFEIHIEDFIGADTSVSRNPAVIPVFPLNFTCWNVSDPNNPEQMKVIVRYDVSKKTKDAHPEILGQLWDSTRVIITFPGVPVFQDPDSLKSSWELQFFKHKYDSLNPVIPPQPGDIFRFRTERNPDRTDVFRFKVEGGQFSTDMAADQMKDIYVVPDPYVVASGFESIYNIGGRSARKVEFVNLPPSCTIRIFTASGKLVKTIYHDSTVDYNRHAWDLTTEDGPEVAFGMYFFVVEAEGIGISRGKFAIIK